MEQFFARELPPNNQIKQKPWVVGCPGGGGGVVLSISRPSIYPSPPPPPPPPPPPQKKKKKKGLLKLFMVRICCKSNFVMTPKKNIPKVFIPQKIFIFQKTPKNIEIQNLEPKKKDLRLHIYKNIRVTLLGLGGGALCCSFQRWSCHIWPVGQMKSASP